MLPRTGGVGAPAYSNGQFQEGQGGVLDRFDFLNGNTSSTLDAAPYRTTIVEAGSGSGSVTQNPEVGGGARINNAGNAGDQVIVRYDGRWFKSTPQLVLHMATKIMLPDAANTAWAFGLIGRVAGAVAPFSTVADVIAIHSTAAGGKVACTAAKNASAALGAADANATTIVAAETPKDDREHRLDIRWMPDRDGRLVKFMLDGKGVGTIKTNIPDDIDLQPFFMATNVGAASEKAFFRYVAFHTWLV